VSVERDVYKVVDWYCPALEEAVLVVVRGSVFHDLVNGKVEGCKKTDCQAKHSPYCLIGTRIQATVKA
jgi:hypothetical protein